MTEGRIALVSGGASGIGAMVCAQMIEAGYVVLSGDVDPSHVEGSQGVRLDVTDESSWRAAEAMIKQKYGRLDVLVNNAGRASRASLEDCHADEFDATMKVNAHGVYLGMRSMRELLAGGDVAGIVNIGSIYGVTGGFGTSFAYHSAKGALVTMTRNASVVLAEAGIRVNAVLPGYTNTPFVAQDVENGRFDHLLGRVPMRRLAEPAEIAAAVLFLSGVQASYITGVCLPVDGGFLAS